MALKQDNERRFHDTKFGGAHKRDFYADGFTEPIFCGLMKRVGDIEDRKVLELGCCEGWFTRYLAQRNARVSTFDISEEATALARERLRPLLDRSGSHVAAGLLRAAGETAPILFTVAAFFLPRLPSSPFDQVMALPYHLYVISTQVPGMPAEIKYGTALVLLARKGKPGALRNLDDTPANYRGPETCNGMGKDKHK